MKKYSFLNIIGIIIFISLVACSSNEDPLVCPKVTTSIIIEKTKIGTKDFYNLDEESDNISEWKKTYIQFLEEFIISNDYKSCQYGLRDMNLDEIPELILIQSDVSIALLEIYSFKDGIFKTGEYTDIKVGSALRVSDNPLYPGLFDLRWGGGVEHYGYITVDKDLLVYEYLWFNNLAPDEVAKENGEPGKNIVSGNVDLINISENLFLDENDNNLFEMFMFGDDDNFQSIIHYTNK